MNLLKLNCSFPTMLVLFGIWSRTKATPTCTQTDYPISVGINTTDGTTLTTFLCTSVNGAVNYTVDTGPDGYSYFDINGSDLILANRLDVEYGRISWAVTITADDGVDPVVTLTVNATTFRSTTTTTSTQPPPGYDWFDEANNRYLFWSVMIFIALMTATCIMLCLRFHRFGRCLPDHCPEYSKMLASFNRQFTCCPVPCNFYDKTENQEDDEEEEEEYIDDTPWGLPPRKPPVPKMMKNAVKETQPISSKSSKATTTVKKSPSKKNNDEDWDRPAVVSPLVIGNVNLDDVGFDGMRSPGFNAPMFTSYGGKKDTASRAHARRY